MNRRAFLAGVAAAPVAAALPPPPAGAAATPDRSHLVAAFDFANGDGPVLLFDTDTSEVVWPAPDPVADPREFLDALAAQRSRRRREYTGVALGGAPGRS